MLNYGELLKHNCWKINYPISKRKRVKILIIIGVGHAMWSRQKVWRLFYKMHPDHSSISQSRLNRKNKNKPSVHENIQ